MLMHGAKGRKTASIGYFMTWEDHAGSEVGADPEFFHLSERLGTPLQLRGSHSLKTVSWDAGYV